MKLFNGAMVIETGGRCTVKAVEPVNEPRLAEISEAPVPTPVAVPCDPGALLIVATVADEEVQVVFDVMFAVVPSV